MNDKDVSFAAWERRQLARIADLDQRQRGDAFRDELEKEVAYLAKKFDREPWQIGGALERLARRYRYR
jgi:hypothetical protein